MDEHPRRRTAWRTAFFALLALFLVTSAFFVYSILDQGVTLTHRAESAADATEDLAIALQLLPELRLGDRRADVLAILRRHHPGALITATDSTIEIGQLTFRFGSDDRLIEVRHPDVAPAALTQAQ
jgi:hypothetical protein